MSLRDLLRAELATTAGPDLSPRARRILEVRHPRALAELLDGLAAPDLDRWLGQAAPGDADDLDPLATLAQTERTLRGQLERLPPGHARLASTASAIAVIAKAREAIARGRPQPETEDTLLTRLRDLDDETLRAIEDTCVAAEARAAKPRPGAPHGVCVTCSAPLAEPLAAPPC